MKKLCGYGALAALASVCSIGAPKAFAEPRPSAFLIVADIDDTTKITDVQYPADTLAHSFFMSAKFFAGMRELFQEMSASAAGTDGPPLVFTSGSPQFLTGRLNRAFQAAKFPNYQLLLKPSFFDSTPAFKRDTFEALSRTHDQPMVFLGDDTEFDPQVTVEFRTNHPERTLKIYIHNVMNKKMPEGVVHYYTAFDVAVSEVADGRLTPEQAIRVGQTLLSTKSSGTLFPDFAVCPTGKAQLPYGSQPNTAGAKSAALDETAAQVADYLVRLCIRRDWVPRSQRPTPPLRAAKAG